MVGVEEARDGDLKAIAGVDLGGPQLDYGAGVDEVFQPAGDALLTLAELPLWVVSGGSVPIFPIIALLPR